ncbi:MAG: alanine--tRNA ligase [Candidatus Eisenbacteria bacterium]
MPDGMSSNEIRRRFIEYFIERGHEKVESAPLIPRDDPTLLFTSAGMVPFKPYYMNDNPPITRAVSVQRCLRLSDLDEVGKTPYHATFFEMLGNFSFGDYFKEETIEWGWEFLTEVIGLPKDRLWVTVHKDDAAAADIWRTRIKFPSERLVALGDKHNFWGPAGDSGPCGPCSEIHLDMGAEAGCGNPGCDPGCECDRFFEIWNLVFPQFLQRADGTREPLKRPGIDTGMGFERLASVVQGAASIHETDTGLPVLAAVRDDAEAASGTRPPEGRPGPDLVVIADHARAATFAIAENILPSNEAQGYIVRRLIRRAVHRGLSLGIVEPFLYRISGVIVDALGEAHPHLVQKREHVALVVKSEEERFHETLTRGSAVFEEMLESLAGSDSKVVPGDVAFSLYDTYGFPLDIAEEMAAERGMIVDREAFQAAMAEQKDRGRRASTFGDPGDAGTWEGKRAATAFVGYELPCACGEGAECETVDTLLSGPVATEVAEVRRARENTLEFTLTESPFYAESGGQVADSGTLTVGGATVEVVNVLTRDERYVHVGTDPGGAITPGAPAEARVDVARRRLIEKNHTATHLLQAALRNALGDHVHQSGSWVGPDRLRFDFTHFSELSAREIAAIEDRVNAWVRADVPVAPESMGLEAALERGATALFGEKYGSEVRVVCVGCGESKVSLELCGGTHVERTGEIGSFAVVSESGVAAGVRRIEAVTGRTAVARARHNAELVRELTDVLKVAPGEALDRARELTAETSKLRKEVERERQKIAGGSVDSLLDGAREVAGIRLLAARTDAPDIKTLRGQADRLRDRLGSGAGLLAAVTEGGVIVIAVVTEDLVKKGTLSAGDLVHEVAGVLGGRGGGKPQLAQGGGGDPARLEQALEEFYEVARRAIES